MYEYKPESRRVHVRILQYGTGSSIAIIGFIIWPDLTTTQLLNYAIKTRPTVLYVHDKHAHGMRLCNTCISNVP